MSGKPKQKNSKTTSPGMRGKAQQKNGKASSSGTRAKSKQQTSKASPQDAKGKPKQQTSKVLPQDAKDKPKQQTSKASSQDAKGKPKQQASKVLPQDAKDKPKQQASKVLPQDAKDRPKQQASKVSPQDAKDMNTPRHAVKSGDRSTQQKRKRYLVRNTGIAICTTAFILLFVFLAPNLIQSASGESPGAFDTSNKSGYSEDSSNSSNSSNSDNSNDSDTPLQKQPDYDVEKPENLFLHKAAISGNILELLLVLTGSYPGDPYELQDAQIEALFPDSPILLGGVAFYFEGDFSQVLMYEKDPSGRMALFNVPSSNSYDYLYMRTEVRFIYDGTIPMFDEKTYSGEPTVLQVQGVFVIINVLDNTPNDGVAFYYASFTADGVSYRIKLADKETGTSGTDRLTEIVTYLIKSRESRTWFKCFEAGFPGKYWIDAPSRSLYESAENDLLYELITLVEAKKDAEYGTFIPSASTVPAIFSLKEVQRTTNQRMNATTIDIIWHVEGKSLDEYSIWWHVGKPRFEAIFDWSVSVSERQKYDCSFISVSPDGVELVPEGFISMPLFQAKEMTLEVVKAREDLRSNSPLFGRIAFMVQFDDNTIVEIVTYGASAEEVWKLLSEIMR